MQIASVGLAFGLSPLPPNRLAGGPVRRAEVFSSPIRPVRRWLGFLLGLLLAFLGFAAPLSAAGTIRDVKFLPYKEGVRIVVDLGRQVPYEQRSFDQPPRLVLDLPDVGWQLPARQSNRAYRFVRGYRFGQLKKGISRLVVDVDRAFEIEKVFSLPPSDTSGFRIVTDILPLARGAAMKPQRVRSSSEVATVSPPRPKPKPRQALPRARPERTADRARPGSGDQAHFHRPKARPGPKLAKSMIVLDPGHGGIDPGASGKGGTFEKNIVLNVALELRRQLLDTGRYDVVLTREDDSFVRLRDRLQIARASGGHLFLSLHADSLANADDVRGAAVYTLSNQASSEEAELLAGKENRADILGGIDLSHHEEIVTQILIDLAQRDANSKSVIMADMMVEELNKVAPMLRKRQQQAGFVVLKSPDMPSALIELGYLSNRSDEKRLNDPDHLADIARAMIKAIDKFFEGQHS